MNKDKLSETESKLVTLNSIISKLEPEIRLAAFEILKYQLFDGEHEYPAKERGSANKEVESLSEGARGSVRDFFASFDPEKPADSTLVLASWFYTQRGSSAFSLDELYGLFDEVGTPRPDKTNMTLRQCSRGGKKLFKQAGHGKYRPTVYGENYFKQEMNLRPGKKTD